MGFLSSGKSNVSLAGLNKQSGSPGLNRSVSNASFASSKAANNSGFNSGMNTPPMTQSKDLKNGLSPVASSAHISGKQNGELILFDIRIDKSNDTSYSTPIHPSSDSETSFSKADENFYQDIIIIKGLTQDGLNDDNVVISGKVVLAVSQPIHMKKLTLRLIGDAKIRIPVGENGLERYSTFDKRIYDKAWDYNYFKPYIFPGNTTNTEVNDHPPKEEASSPRPSMQHKRTKSGSNLKRLASLSNLAFSTTSLSSLSQVGTSNYDILQPGNYELPFTFVAPSSIPESLELKECTVGYQFSCIIERASKKSDLILKKKLKIIRTLSADSVDLSETVLISNTWPGKIEYSLSTPAKSNIIGSSIPIRFEFVPLSKKLRLGTIKIQLIEQISVFSPAVGTKNFERVCCKKKVADPLRSCRYYDEELASEFYEEIIPPENYTVEDRGEFLDKWDTIIYLDTPSSLSKIAQDCVVGNFVKIRHKLKFVVGLINPDDHVSELRAALPVQFFISPFVPITAKSFYVDPVFHKNSNPNFSSDILKEDDIFLFDESKNLLVESVLKAYKVASSEQLNNLGQTTQNSNNVPKVDFINGNLRPQLVNKYVSKSTSALNNMKPDIEDSTPLSQSHVLLPRLKNNVSQNDFLEYSKKHSSVVIADMMAPPDYNKRLYDQLLSVNKLSTEPPPKTEEDDEEGSLTTTKKGNSFSNLNLQRLKYGVSNISSEKDNFIVANNTGNTDIDQPHDEYVNTPQLNRIPSYHDAMVPSTKMQNPSVEVNDLPPVYDPKWDTEYKNSNDILKPTRNKLQNNDSKGSDLESNEYLQRSSSFYKSNKNHVKTARFQLGVGMTPLTTGGDHISLSKENSSKSLNTPEHSLSRNNSTKNISQLFGLGKKD